MSHSTRCDRGLGAGVVSHLAEEALDVSWDDLDAAEVHQLERLLLDSLGCAVAAGASHTASSLRAALGTLGGTPEATVLVSGEQTSALNALLVNGAMLRFLDLNDVQTSERAPGAGHGHNSEIFPVVLALCERRQLTGPDLLVGAWLGYELATRFTEAIPPPRLADRGWNSDTRASFAVPFVAGRLLGLTVGQIVDAVGISLSRGMVLEVIDHPHEINSMAKNLRYPLTAYQAVLSTYLAAHGLTGPERALEGGDGFIERVLDGRFDHAHLLDRTPRRRVLQAGMKRFASCYGTHGHLSATLELVREHDVNPEDVERVDIRTTTRGARHTGEESRRHPTNKETADHSSYYVQAAVIVDRQLGPAQYSAERMADPRIRRLASMVSIEGDPAFDAVYPSARVAIRLRNGQVLERYVAYPAGHPANPLSDEDVEDKFRELTASYLSDAAVSRAIAAVWALDTCTDIRAFARLFVADAHA